MMSRTIAVTSGKGGVGKTNISVNLALSLSRKGHRVCLFDADLGLANINILLGLEPKSTLVDVVKGESSFTDIMMEYEGISVLPGSSGVEELANLSPSATDNLIQSFESLGEHDFILFDTSAGVSRDVVAFCLASSEVLLVITPEPTSLTDAYALLKILLVNGFSGQTRVIVNQCKNMDVAQLVYRRFKTAVSKHLNQELSALGVIFEDDHVTRAVKEQRALLTSYPDSNAAKCIDKLVSRLLMDKTGDLDHPDMKPFWERCLGIFSGPLNLKGAKAPIPEDGGRVLPPKDLKENGRVQPPPKEEKTAVPERTGPPSEAASLKGREDALTESLIRGIASVSEELKKLRHAIEKTNGNGTDREGGTDSPLPAPIRLDFEGFLDRKLKDSKGTEHGE
jgi:flagellar biosynthesis protein FlhG